jgi:hypothetical protein
MAVTFNHTIVAAKDREASARFLVDLLGLEDPTRRASSTGPTTNNGGRGFYCFDPAGHGLEVLTVAD